MAALFGAGIMAHATNILLNPGFDTTPIFSAWTAQTTEGWSENSATAQGSLIRDGANALWMQGVYRNGGTLPYYNMGASQTFACSPGSTYTADAWFSQFTSGPSGIGGSSGLATLFGSDAGGVEDGWVEVQFLDSSHNILTDYKSAILSPLSLTLPGSAGVQTIDVSNLVTTTSTLPNDGATMYTYTTWLDCPVTNQFDVSTIGPNTDPATESVTNTISNGIMTAPAGAAYVKFFVGISQFQYEAGASYWDDCTLNQLSGPSPSVIANVTPNNLQFFWTNSSLTFNVTSASTGGAPLPTNPTSGVTVMVNGVNQSANLQFGGTPTALTVTLPGLSSNSLYQVAITVVNSATLTTTYSGSFDTLQPDFIVPFETFDFSNGMFIQNPIPTTTPATNSYFGLSGTLGVDMQSAAIAGGTTLIPNYPDRTDGDENFERTPDAQLPLYLAAEATNSGVYMVDHSYNNGGQWFNYTRNPYPSGPQQAWLRTSAGGGPGSEDLNILTSGYGTSTQATNRLGEFDVPNPNLYNGPQGTDWTKFYWVPLTDNNGNLVPVNIPSGQQTLQLLSSTIGGENGGTLIFVPFPTSGLVPTIANISPANGGVLQPASTGLSFTAGAGSGTVSSSGIGLTLNGVNVTSGLGFSGTGPISVTYSGLSSNTIYTAVISVTNSANAVTTRTVTFDTFSEPGNFYVKLEDFDFSGGIYDTNGNGLVPNAYLGDGLPGDVGGALTNVDYSHLATSGTFPYRGPNGLAQEVTTDVPLPGYTTGSDYDVGFFNGGDWANYTRNYPSGKYYVYGRLAGFSGIATISQVTAGQGTTSQTLLTLGTCQADVNHQGWTTWNWCPLLNNGNPVLVTLGGTETLRVASGGNINANYLMFVPVKGILLTTTQSSGNVGISFPTTLGSSYRVWEATTVKGAWTLLKTVGGTGAVQTVNVAATGSQVYFKVTSP
ncbi:MAG TPA: hypothetical protein VNX46_12185 [Candidatus Acidoferrum sp.]|nr:hypothetical protein [Candidatus Acidoferrum sp.]